MWLYQVEINIGTQTYKQNCCKWLSESNDVMSKDKIKHCWSKTGLLKAFNLDVQREAISKFHELFDKEPKQPVGERDYGVEYEGMFDSGEREMCEDAQWELAKDFISFDSNPICNVDDE